ncbi:MAG TPA: alpha-amylase family glycosyl hydrolase [Roseiflexaceae bacterium]|nr:alpha-amylase family glycosyl hydrolase [Roseiflexaceae bacterium]
MAFTVSQTRELLTVRTPEVELGFSCDDGGLRVLRHGGGPNLAGHGEPRPSVDICVGGKGWLAERVFVRYLSYTVEERDGAVEVVVVIGIGALKVFDRYRVTGSLITRRVSVENVGEDEVQLCGVRMMLPWLRVGPPESCCFDAPGNSVRPRVPLAVAADQRPGVLPRRFFAPGLRQQRALEPAPTIAAGLMALHDAGGDGALLCWYHSAVEPALPQVEGNGQAVTLSHVVEVAEWLRAEVGISADAQYILLLDMPWSQALEAFQRTWALAGGALPPDAPPAAPWVRDAAIYEVHPARFGGFAGLADALPGLTALGVNTLCLLPIWDYGAPDGRPWDGNWQAGNPYAVADFGRLAAGLGGPADLRRLVQAAHARGIRVLLDLPLAGVAPGAGYLADHPEWFCQDEHGQPARAPGADTVVAFDWANPGLRDHFAGWALGLLRDYELDGFRVIPPRAPLPNWARGLPYHASASTLGYLSLIERLRHAIRQERPWAAILGALGGPACAQRQDFAVDELPHHMFFHLALNRVTPAELGDWLTDHWGALPPGTVRACFTESHHTRLLNPIADGMRGSRISRMLLAGMVLCGFVPLIWSGQEEGEEAFIAALLGARARSPALRHGAVRCNAAPCDSPQVFSVLRTHGEDAVLGLLNVGPHRHTVTLALPLHELALPDGDYQIVDLLRGQRWCEGGRHAWARDELHALRLTLEPFGAYGLALHPAASEVEGSAQGRAAPSLKNPPPTATVVER